MAYNTSQYTIFQVTDNGEITVTPRLGLMFWSIIPGLMIPVIIAFLGQVLEQSWLAAFMMLVTLFVMTSAFLKGIWTIIAPELIIRPSLDRLSIRSFFPSQRVNLAISDIAGIEVYNFVAFKTINLKSSNGRLIPLAITDGLEAFEDMDGITIDSLFNTLVKVIPVLEEQRGRLMSDGVLKAK